MIKFDPEIPGYLEWLSTNWEENFALFSVVFNILVRPEVIDEAVPEVDFKLKGT